MINLVVYGDENKFMDIFIKNIEASLFNYEIKYKVYMYSEYNDEMDIIVENRNKKIFIVDKDYYNFKVDIISRIRKYDKNSIIIIFSKDNIDLLDSKMVFLDFMLNDYYKNKFMLLNNNKIELDNYTNDNELNVEYKIFTFTYKWVVYRIPFSDITYIEKESNVKRCIIHTICKKDYYIIRTLDGILIELDNNFKRTHQSCIVNLNNIKKMNLGNNIIIFKNGDKTDLITNRAKKDIKNYIGVS